MRLNRPALALAACVAAAWPTWRWFALRLGDGGDEPLGAVPLAIAVVAAWRAGGSAPAAMWGRAGGILLAVAAALAATGAPPLAVAAPSVAGLLAAARGLLGWRIGPGVAALALLALPVVASLQFWAGGPLRQVAAWLAAGALAAGGLPVSVSGVVLAVDGLPVVVDGPCSGVRLLWTACVAMAACAAWLQWGWRRTAGAIALAVVAAVLANAWRSASLALAAAGLLPESPWLHTATGLCALAVALTACWLALRRQPAAAPRIEPPAARVRYLAPLGGALLLACAPWIAPRPGVVATGFPGWPERWDGQVLVPLPPDPADLAAAELFPGRIARFAAGDRRIVLRWVAGPTRALHPAGDCLRATGWRVEPARPQQDAHGWWSCVSAERDGHRLEIREQIRAADGRSWPDPSLWWWQARPIPGGYWAVTEER